MDEKDWLIISTLFDEKNITKTAEKLYISQPALTYRIQQIENQFGVLLVHRGRQGVDFTNEGELIASYSKEMLLRLQTLKENVLNHDKHVRGTLRLGVTKAFALYKLPSLLNDFSSVYPDVDFSVKAELNKDLIQFVLKQELHLCIIRGNHYWPYKKHVIAKENVCLFSSKEIDINKLPQLPRIDYITDPNLRLMIDSWWKEHFNSPPLVSMKVDNMEIAKRMVLNGLGYTIAPGIIFEKDNLQKILINDSSGKPIEWLTSLLYRQEVLKLTSVHAFVEFLLERYSTDQSISAR